MEFRIFSENVLVVQYLMRLGMLLLLALQIFSISRIKNRAGNRWMLTLVLLLVSVYLNDKEVFSALSLDSSSVVSMLLYFPVLAIPVCSYFAILYYIKPQRDFKRTDLLLFLPMLLDWSMMLPVLVNPSIAEVWSGWSALRFFGQNIFMPLCVIYSFWLWYRAYKLLKGHARDVRLLHSSVEQVDLKWLYGFAGCVPLLYVSHLLRETFFIPLLYDLGDIIALGVFMYLGVNISMQRDVFPYEIDIKSVKNSDAKSEPSFPKESSQFETKAHELEILMRDKKPYLNPNLNLGDLAYQLNIKPQELSQLLATIFSINFYSYINKYRVEQCKLLLSDAANSTLSMEGIASKAGFRSKSTFYARFKEFTGVTPMQFMEES